MATERQIEANRRNAALSTGPKTEDGKARSRLNATKHGLAAELPALEDQHSPEFQDRRAKWAASYQLEGEAAHWALDRAIGSSFRIERCEHAVEAIIDDTRARAGLAWDQDRDAEAAAIAGRLSKAPVLVSRQLQTTLSGVILLLDAWFALASTLEGARDWSEAEASKALDLLGVAPDVRANRTAIDSPEGSESREFRLTLALKEIGRLEDLRDEAMVPLDEMARRNALAGDMALLSKEARLVLRYERDAWKRFREAMREVQGVQPAAAPPVVAPPPPRAVAPTPAPAAPKRSFEDERRALLAEAAPYRDHVIGELQAMGIDDEDGWIEALERRIAAFGRGSEATERTQIAPFAAGLDPARLPG